MPTHGVGRSLGIVVVVAVGVGLTVAAIGHYAGVTGAPLGALTGGVTAVLVGRLVRKPHKPIGGSQGGPSV
jgi:hypothetical protein